MNWQLIPEHTATVAMAADDSDASGLRRVSGHPSLRSIMMLRCTCTAATVVLDPSDQVPCTVCIPLSTRTADLGPRRTGMPTSATGAVRLDLVVGCRPAENLESARRSQFSGPKMGGCLPAGPEIWRCGTGGEFTG